MQYIHYFQNMKNPIITSLCLSLATLLNGQTTLVPQLLSNGGGTISTPSVSLSLSIGEPVSGFISTGNVQLSQGYQRGNVQSVLAIQNIDFQAIRISKDSVQLRFSVANFDKIKDLMIQFSLDNHAFSDLKIVSNSDNNAPILDANNTPFPSYYRLKITQTDGTIAYSSIRVVEAAALGFTLTPNPVSDILVVHLEKSTSREGGTSSSVFLRILDVQGRLVQVFEYSKHDGNLRLSLAHLPTGVYFCQLNDAPTVLKFFKN
jgi:hypothetical protein